MSESRQPKTRYKTTNWPQYNAALKARGALTIWLDKDMQWYEEAAGVKSCLLPESHKTWHLSTVD